MNIDRLSQALRPDGPCAMQHLWHDLLFLHWEVPVETLQLMLPNGLSVDTFDGRAYIALVPFRITEIKHPRLVPVPGFSQFPEINVRTYVHRNGADPGVWFFSLDAANPFACMAARALYKLPYFFAKMSQSTTAGGKGTTKFRSQRYLSKPFAAASVDYRPFGEASPTKPGTLDHFFLERYLLYSEQNSQLFVGQVHHKPYQAQQACISLLEETLVAAAGITKPPFEPIVHFSRGVSVDIFSIRPV